MWQLPHIRRLARAKQYIIVLEYFTAPGIEGMFAPSVTQMQPFFPNAAAWQNLITSASDFPLGSKSEPPFAPPMGKVVRGFLKICTKPRNFMMLRFIDGWNLSPPLKGPMALLN